MQIYIAGIHTNVGKTHVAGAICALFNYDYFKLIQAGNPQDRDVIKKIINAYNSQNLDSKISESSILDSKKPHIFDNGITLQTPCSPHIAMQNENRQYSGYSLQIPNAKNLVIELAGGLFTPLDSKICMIDYISRFRLDCILVGGYYLGSINHILLSLESLHNRNINILNLVMFGNKDSKIDNFIKSYSNINISHLEYFNKSNLKEKFANFKKEIGNVIL